MNYGIKQTPEIAFRGSLLFMFVLLCGVIIFLCLLCGCGHQGFFYASGKYTNIGFDPNTQSVGIQYVNGENVSALNKENAKLVIETKDALDANGKQTTKVAKITYEIGETTTGYDVDLEKVKK